MRSHTIANSALIVLVVGLAILTVPEFSATAIYGWPWPLALPLALVISTIVGIALLAKERKVIVPNWKWIAGSGILLSGGAISLLASGRFFNGLPVWAAMVLLGSLLFGFCQLSNPRQVMGLLIRALGWLTLGLTLVSLYRWLIVDAATGLGLQDPLNALAGEPILRFRLSEFRNSHPFGHQNYTAGAMLLVIPLHAWLMTVSGMRQRILWGTAVLLDLICLISTFSRGAWMGLAGAGALFFFWLWRTQSLSRKLVRTMFTGGLALTVLMFLLNPRLASSASSILTRGTTGIDQIREGMARAGLEMGMDHWLLGVGPGNMTKTYPQYRAGLDTALEDFYQLHITPLQIWVEQGLPGVVGWCLILLGCIESFGNRTRDHSQVSTAAAFGLVGYGLFSLTDYQLDVPFIAVMVCLYLAILAGENSRTLHLESRAFLCLAGSLSLVTATTCVLLVPELRSRQLFASAVRELRAGQTESFLAKATKAAEVSRSPEYFLNQLAAYHMETWASATNDTARTNQRQVAVEYLQESLQANPDQEFCHFNLGWLLHEDDPKAAAIHFVRAAHLVPDRKGVYQGLGLCLMSMGNTNAACRAFAIECVISPSFLTSVFWVAKVNESLWPVVRKQFEELLTEAIHQGVNDESLRSILDRRLAATRWYWSGDTNQFAGPRWPSSTEQLWQSIVSNDRSFQVPMEPPVSWKHLYQAWARPDKRRAELVKALILATEITPNQAIIDRLEAWVAQPSWGDVIRNQPPENLFRAYRRQRSAFKLLARNMDGINPTDLCPYVDNYVMEQFFPSLLGSKSDVPSPLVLEWLDDLVSHIPNLDKVQKPLELPQVTSDSRSK